MTEDDKRTCCLLEIQETEAKYLRTLEDIEKVGSAPRRRRLRLPGSAFQGRATPVWRGWVVLGGLSQGVPCALGGNHVYRPPLPNSR